MTLTEGRKTLPPEVAEHFEVVDGRLVEKDVAQVPHGRMLVDLILRLGAQAPGLALATDVRVVFHDPDQQYDPDLIGARPGNPVPLGEGWYRGVPDLVVEVLSRSTEATDRGPKRRVYAAAGVPWYWLADPARRTVEVLRLDPAAGTYALVRETPLDALAIPDDLR